MTPQAIQPRTLAHLDQMVGLLLSTKMYDPVARFDAGRGPFAERLIVPYYIDPGQIIDRAPVTGWFPYLSRSGLVLDIAYFPDPSTLLPNEPAAGDDETLPYRLLRIRHYRRRGGPLPTLFVYGGPGISPGALAWLRAEAQGQHAPRGMIGAMTYAEAAEWVLRHL